MAKRTSHAPSIREGTLALALTFASLGCDGSGCSYAPATEAPAIPSDDLGFVPAIADDLGDTTPATRVEVHATTIVVSNHSLIDTWPASDVERARQESSGSGADWPRIRIDVIDLSAHGAQIPRLLEALGTARLAERSATGAGTGASMVDLDIDPAVPFGTVERVLFTAGLAGYAAPRFVVGQGNLRRAIAWPTAPSSPTTPRLSIGVERIEGCTSDAPSSCVESLASDPDTDVVLEVDPEVSFGRLAPFLQHAVRRYARVRIVGRRTRAP